VGDKDKPHELKTEDLEWSDGKYSWDQEWILRVSRICL
jgi:hypothetical protein